MCLTYGADYSNGIKVWQLLCGTLAELRITKASVKIRRQKKHNIRCSQTTDRIGQARTSAIAMFVAFSASH
jgi:hypothetical protein